MIQIDTAEFKRIKYILSYASIFTLCFSVLYSLLLLWGHIDKIQKNREIDIFPIYLSIIIPVLFFTSYILNLKNKVNISKLILISTILSINFTAGLWWGFDLPSVLLSYVFCIVILTLTSKTKENILYTLILISSIFIGNYFREIFNVESSWYNSNFGINDIVEFSIMFIFIIFILMKFNQIQNKTLDRALKAEDILSKERDNLEKIVIEKTKEIKQMQMENISKMYHLIEFGKLSSGLYHDLITPIQTMNLYIEKLVDENMSNTVENIKNTHHRLCLMLENIRKQISLKIEDEEFNLTDEVNDLINLVKNNYFKNGVNIVLENKEQSKQSLISKKSIINHITLNLISNAYEACLLDMDVNHKSEYWIKVKIGNYKNKNYVSVSDNGIGIDHKNLNKIFEHFYSSKKTINNNCGVGLSSSKYYAEKYLNGKIYVESELNLGTTLTLLF